MTITIDQILAYITDLGMIVLQVAFVLVLGIVVGKIGGWTINKVFSKVHTVESFRKSSIGRTILRAGYTPASFFATCFKFAVYIFTLFVIVDIFFPKNAMASKAVDFLPKLIGASLILLFGTFFGDGVEEVFVKDVQVGKQTQVSLGQVLRFVIYFVSITIALAYLGFDVTILYLFAQAAALAIGISFGVMISILLISEYKENFKTLLKKEGEQ
jgi:small-conductance mechanosensitive channel